MRPPAGRSLAGAAAVLVAALAVVPPARLAAQSEGSIVSALPGTTRSAGLAGAGVALVGDAGGVFANPAAIATIRHLSLEASHERFIAGTAVSAAALALRAGRVTWGFGAQALDYGAEPEIVPDPATSGRRGIATGATFHPYELLAVSSLVYRRGLIALGVSGKYDRQQFGAEVADAWAGDVGVALAVFDLAALGVSVQNLGGDLGAGARLPCRTRAGFTLNYTDPQGAFRLLTTVEGQWATGGGRASVMIVGLEGGLVAGGVGLAGRLGYATRPAVTATSRFTAGGGVVLGRLQLDYALQGYAALGGAHRVGLRWTP